MEFTYKAYENLVKLLRKKGYEVTNYHDYKKLGSQPCAILRHDIDYSVKKAYELAVLEQKLGVASTWFVLMASEFYNPAAAANREMLLEMAEMGHEIGLHFDEISYDGGVDARVLKKMAEKERGRLEELLEIPIRTVSMHRPSKETLEADWKFPHMINSYGVEFFKDFKYVSDSRMHWREDVEAVVQGQEYNKLHILTHAFWYAKELETTKEKLESFIRAAANERYDILNQNFRDLSEFVLKDEI